MHFAVLFTFAFFALRKSCHRRRPGWSKHQQDEAEKLNECNIMISFLCVRRWLPFFCHTYISPYKIITSHHLIHDIDKKVTKRIQQQCSPSNTLKTKTSTNSTKPSRKPKQKKQHYLKGLKVYKVNCAKKMIYHAM